MEEDQRARDGRERGREKEVKTVRLTSTTNPMSELIVHSCNNDINPSMQASSYDLTTSY